MTLVGHTASMVPYLHPVWACLRPGGKNWRTARVRLCVFSTLLVLLSLLTLSGPHLVHHFTELHPQADHHTQED
jgi:hypothetical protein